MQAKNGKVTYSSLRNNLSIKIYILLNVLLCIKKAKVLMSISNNLDELGNQYHEALARNYVGR